MPQRLTVRAYAKINLHLEVGQRDPRTGYHALETLFQTVSLFDTLRVTPAADLRLVGRLGGTPRDAANLILQAAAALQKASRRDRGARIHLTKRIPLAAGLGGGSTDAAAILYTLNRFWNTGLPDTKLRQIAKALGADVPFLLGGGCAMGTRRGDRVWPVEAPERRWWFVLVTSTQGTPTAQAYGRLAARDKATDITPATPRPSARLRGLARAWSRGAWPQPTCNSFERTAFAARPRLRAFVHALKAAGAVQAHLSGSGPAVFGLYASARTAREAAGGLALKEGERVFVARPVADSPRVVRV